MSLDVGTLAGYLDLDTSAFDRKLDRTDETARRSGRKSGKSFGDEFGKESEHSLTERMTSAAGRIMKSFGGMLGVTAKPTAMTVATAFSAQFVASVAAGLASGAGKLAHGLGAAVALLPAAGVAAGMALGTVKLALQGVGDALSAGLAGDTEAYAEALEGLSPAARGVAEEIVGLRGQVDSLKTLVQDNFFAQFGGQVGVVGGVFLRQMHLALGDVSTGLGQAVSQALAFLETPAGFRGVWTTLDNGRQAVNNVTGGLAGLLPAIMPLFTVGSTFLPGLTDGFGGLTARVAEFMQHAEQTGQLRDFIQGGLDALSSLIDTGRQVVRIFGNIGSVISTAFSSGGGLLAGLGLQTGGLLDAFERLTARAAEFVQTAEGSETVAQVFSVIRGLLNALFGTLSRVAGIVASVFGPILPQVAGFASAVTDLANAVMDTLEPALQVASDVLGSAILPALTSLVAMASENRAVLGALAGIIVALFTAWAVSAGAAAIATIAATWPLLAVGAAVGVLATLVAIHFDTIQRWISNVFHWVADNWPLLLAILTGPIGLAVLLIVQHWDTIWQAAMAAKDMIVGAFQFVVDFLFELPNKIADIGASMWEGLKSGLISVVNWILSKIEGLINGIIGAYNALPNIGPIGDIDDINLPRLGGSNQVTSGGGGGGRALRMHSGGHLPGGPNREFLRILQGGEEVLSRHDPRNRVNMGTPAAGAPLVVGGRMVIDVQGGDQGLVTLLRQWISAEGGDVQLVLGRGRV